MKADKWLKPAAPISHQADIFRVRGDLVPDHLPTRCSYGGLERTLEAYVVAYGCGPLEWDIQTLDGEGEEYSPMFRLLPRKGKGPYTRLQLLAVFRALRFNDFFRSLSFKDVDFCGLWSMDDPQFKGRGGNIISTARRGSSHCSPCLSELI